MSLICGLWVWPQLSAAWPGIQEQIDRFRSLHPLAKVMLLVFIVGFIAYGSTKTNQVDQTSGTNMVDVVEGGETNASPTMLMTAMPFPGDQPPTVTPEDIARGWQQCEVRTNCNVSYAMPEGAILATNWWVRGAYEDVKSFDLGGWRFPFGSNEYESAWAFAWGRLRFALADAKTEIAAVSAPMSAVPYRSRLWTVETTNSTLITWEDFALGRVPSASNQPTSTNYQHVSAQIELAESGDFITRWNEVETVCRRVDPDDWDDDGWRNEDDPDPYVWNECWDVFCQELPDGANESSYCWIEIRPRWHSYIEFVGDGSSDLDDPYLWAKAGETYRVQLLIGKTYFIESTQPLDVVGQSSPSIEIAGNGTTEIEVVWPVSFSALESNGGGFLMIVRPSGLGGFFNWTDSCCTVYGLDHVFRYECSGNCGCSGCYAHGYYEYEGYRLETTGGWCGCSPDDHGDDQPSAGVSVSFSKRAIIFEDSYANTTDDIIPWNSTATELICTINGGPNGGYVQIGISGGDNLIQYTGQALPYSRVVAPNEQIKFANRYKATVESTSEDDIEVTATFVENETGWVSESEAKATAVRVEVWPSLHALQNDCHYRRKVGVGEVINCKARPNVVGFHWQGGGGTVNGSGVDCQYVCPLYAESNQLKIMGGGCEYTPRTSVVEPIGVLASEIGFQNYVTQPGHAGGITLTMSLQALPLDVNFSGIMIEEIPDAEASREGYFADTYFMGEWYHGQGQGAGDWRNVMGDNVFLHDEAGFRVELPQLDARGFVSLGGTNGWITGGMSWSVPCGWGSLGMEEGDDPIGSFATGALQEFEIESSGNCEVRKHANVVRREITGRVILNGVEMP